jgi:hypothetical protein
MARPEIIKAREESRDAATTLRIEIIALEEMIMDMANYQVWQQPQLDELDRQLTRVDECILELKEKRAIVDFLEES